MTYSYHAALTSISDRKPSQFHHEHNIRDVYYPRRQTTRPSVTPRFRRVVRRQVRVDQQPGRIKTLDYDDDTLVARVIARSPTLDLEMTINDTVDFDRDLFEGRDSKHQAGCAHYGSTPFDPSSERQQHRRHDLFDPEFNGLVAYKGRTYVVMNGSIDDQIRLQSMPSARSAKDSGALGAMPGWKPAVRNAIAQGSVDATGMINSSFRLQRRDSLDLVGVWQGYREVSSPMPSCASAARRRFFSARTTTGGFGSRTTSTSRASRRASSGFIGDRC
jgi:hypothetical protein